MNYASDVLSVKQRACGSNDSTKLTSAQFTNRIGSTAIQSAREIASNIKKNLNALPSGKSSLLLNRSIKCLLLGGLATSLGMNRDASTTADVDSNLPLPKTFVPNDASSSCVQGIISWGVGSLFVQNPLPLLVGIGECLPGVSAQQTMGNEFQVNTYTNNDQEFPSVASFINDNFVVIWQNALSGSYEISGQLFDGNATMIGNEFQCNTYTSRGQMSPSVASFSNNNFVVTWMSEDQDGSDFGVYAQLFYGNGTMLGSEFLVNTYTNYRQRYPSIASFSSGNFVIAWHSDNQDGSSYGVYSQLFDGNANRIGNESQVNTYTSGDQYYPSTATFSNGNFVVVWHNDPNPERGIYGQLFEGPIVTSSTTSTTSLVTTSSSSSILTSNQYTSSTEVTTVESSTTSSMSSSRSTIPSTSSFINESISSSAKSSEITNPESVDSNIGLIVGVIAGVG